jgi:hypothetical protein
MILPAKTSPSALQLTVITAGSVYSVSPVWQV